MDPLTISAASGMRARMEALELLANNIANAVTSGYKSDREFYNLYVAPEAQDAAAPATTAPVIERHWTDFSQGTLAPTGNPLDMALSGNGFFGVQGPAGRLYTRNGSFRVAPSGRLETQDGYAVRSVGGGALRLDPALPFEVARDGAVRQQGQAVGSLEVVQFADPHGLAKRDGVYFQITEQDSKPAPASGVEIHQGKLESANVPAAETAVRLVSVLRQFEMLQKALGLAGEMNRRAVEEVARVSG